MGQVWGASRGGLGLGYDSNLAVPLPVDTAFNQDTSSKQAQASVSHDDCQLSYPIRRVRSRRSRLKSGRVIGSTVAFGL